MSASAKKPLPAGASRLNSTDTTSPSRSPRASAQNAQGTLGGTPARTRSLRGANPAAARAAATARGASSLSNSADSDDSARAEAVAAIEDLKERLAKADAESDQSQKQAEVLQSRLDESTMEQAKLEERVHEAEEQIETLKNEKREAARKIREMETIYEAERSAMLKEKEEMANREEEMQIIINRLKETLNQKNAEDDSRLGRQSATSSPNVDGGSFAPPSSLQRSDSRNNSKILLQKDKLIESLRLELAEAQIKLVETENQGGGRVHEVERLLMEARMANARLMEDNESYQLLLQEKTLHGDFGKGDFSYLGGVATNQDALAALEGRPSSGGAPSTPPRAGAGVTSLADELGDAADAEQEHDVEHMRRLESELRASKDSNKALTLYINKIIERLLQHQEFEHILDTSTELKPGAGAGKDKELPPPPADAQSVGASLLQRAKSIAIGTSGSRPRPRPMSVLPTPSQTAHNNPETAPSIPIGLTRSTSTRRAGRPMSEQFVGGTAGVVSAMYANRGSQPAAPVAGEPLASPTATNPRHSQGFFRAPSAQGAGSAGNFPGMRSETSSVSGESAGDSVGQSSPPRGSSMSTMEKGHNTYAGNKPRPLRLVQENTEPAKMDKRASWIGWAQQAWNKNNETGEIIKE